MNNFRGQACMCVNDFSISDEKFYKEQIIIFGKEKVYLEGMENGEIKHAHVIIIDITIERATLATNFLFITVSIKVCYGLTISFKGKGVPLHAMEAHGGRGCIAPTHT
jgi:hypothetical protein